MAKITKLLAEKYAYVIREPNLEPPLKQSLSLAKKMKSLRTLKLGAVLYPARPL